MRNDAITKQEIWGTALCILSLSVIFFGEWFPWSIPWTDVWTSIITGRVSGAVLVVWFDRLESKKRELSRAHIIERFIRDLFSILTVIRSALGVGLEDPSGSRRGIMAELERTLGRYNPRIHLNRIVNLTPEKHKAIAQELSCIQSSLSELFLHSISHKTIEDKVASSVAEMQGWIDTVLSNYAIFPEIIQGRAGSEIMTRWIPGMSNLIENTFAVLTYALDMQELNDVDLRWGSRGR